MKQPTALSKALDDLLVELGLPNVARQARLEKEWPAVVGSALLARATAPARLRHGVLTVLAENHAVAQELQFLRPALIAAARAVIGADAVSDVRITVGAIPATGEPAGGPEPGADPAADAVPRPPPPPGGEADPEGLDGIADAETRRILLAISRKAAARTP